VVRSRLGVVGTGSGRFVVVWVELVWVELVWVELVWVEVEGSIAPQFLLSALSTISSRVALLNLSVPLEDSPPSLGVQYFTVRHSSVTVTLPVCPGGQGRV
jgi:hypothetical protein